MPGIKHGNTACKACATASEHLPPSVDSDHLRAQMWTSKLAETCGPTWAALAGVGGGEGMWRPLELQTGSISSCPVPGLLCMGQLLQGSLGVDYGWQQYPVFMLWC